jgi:hypothetical protein
LEVLFLLFYPFGLLLPTFGHFTKKGLWSFLFNALLAFLKAHYELVMNQESKIEQLLYLYNADTDKASWATYDVNLDSWTKEYLGENPKPAKDFQTPVQQIQFGFTYAASAPKKELQNPLSHS